MASMAAQVAAAPLTSVSGTWQRHVSARFSEQALEGRRGHGRWGTSHGFAVLYLGRPTDSVIIEAYRHLVDPVLDELPTTALAPRVLVTASVSVTDIVDLRTAVGRMHTGLTMPDLTSATHDREAYARCQEVAQVAHQLGRHGILAPSATQAGETLVLFMDRLPDHERPVRSTDDQLWTQLPADPRRPQAPRLRVVRDEI
ncbi:hypothetical protein GCM10027451_25840 [Geodermatophilus aquaeductus]|uniref:RES domain-containing protein n=1 Tax=Geodermatophilus aquaeductus TaxID=1564161 RepID=A0A521EL22_9ACTN|nr:RES family NAD+ phosphorylase [Geodermatophilus aquaeductus]SMO84605.1 RES domain-containing protein [Geodermatophilus aquaeductus]